MHQLASWFLVLSIMLLFVGLSFKLYRNFIIKGAISSVYQNKSSKSSQQARKQDKQKILSGNETRVNVNPLHNTIKAQNTRAQRTSRTKNRTYQQTVRSYREYKKQNRVSR